MFTRAQARTFPRRERLERRKLRVVQAEFKIRHRTLNVQTQRRKMQAGPSPIHSDQPTCNNKATTNIQWSEPEVEKLLSLVGAHMESGSVNKASLQFQNKTRDQIRDAHNVLKPLIPIHPPLSTLDTTLCMAVLQSSFRPRPRPGKHSVGQPRAYVRWGVNDGLSDADAEGETDDDEIKRRK
ncbi:hypothetical protein B0H14DRAFT_2768707 [Mycena olivaceomarginata]|nr:hypothetical protein B0H14DRAFT_2768707 [Mycena olivaceomarginata]